MRVKFVYTSLSGVVSFWKKEYYCEEGKKTHKPKELLHEAPWIVMGSKTYMQKVRIARKEKVVKTDITTSKGSQSRTQKNSLQKTRY